MASERTYTEARVRELMAEARFWDFQSMAYHYDKRAAEEKAAWDAYVEAKLRDHAAQPAPSPVEDGAVRDALEWWETEMRVARARHSLAEQSIIETTIRVLRKDPTPATTPGTCTCPAQEGLFHPVTQVWFRAGLIACREYMARFVESQDPVIANSIRANWWPELGADFGPPRQLDFAELTEGEFGATSFRAKTKDEVSPTQEALPIALGFLEHAPKPSPDPPVEEPR